jgi:hypothetical protein
MDTQSTLNPGSSADQDLLSIAPAVLRELRRALRSIRYGAIELVIHEGRVVQLELREKVRFETALTEHKK